MRSRYRINDDLAAHFITSTIVEWLPVFTSEASCKWEKHKESPHQVWQEGFHPQAITSDEMMLQKIEYLHNNPVRAGYVASPEHWRYSSAHEWLPGAQPMLRCDSWR